MGPVGTSAVSPGRAPQVEVFPGPSRQSLAIRRVLQVSVRPLLDLWSFTPALPWPYLVVDAAGRALPPLPHTTTRPVRLAHCRAEWLRSPSKHPVPRRAGARRAILYLHGGGFVCCGLHSHRRLVSRISAACAAPALLVDYRQLPGTPVSRSVDDCLDGYRWLRQRGYRPEEIVFVGDSAGGYLAFMSAIVAHERRLGYPGAVVGLSPFIDTDPTRREDSFGDMWDPLFTPNSLRTHNKVITRAEGRMVRSPVDADLWGMPPVLVQCGADELLSVDAQMITAHVAAAGGEARLEMYEGQFHVFQAAADLVPEARTAISRIGEFVRSLA